jgi:hypothetical protein
MFDGHYNNWILARMNCIKKYINADYFKNKTLLELGCGHAHIGNMFYNLGADVTSSDARNEHLLTVNNLYPHIKTLLLDCDNNIEDKINKYNIIIHWGLLYHLHEIEMHITEIGKKCDVLFLETEVSDSYDDNLYINVDENGYDQAYNLKGIRPSPAYVEKQLIKNGFKYKLIMDSILNSESHIYDWESKNTETYRQGLRRFWICWKNVESPINHEYL